ncbi:Exo-beta-1,3-glucanase, GH17 family [Geosmithia morbida]|uniref:Probable beta-glucosidase btgE n=1 Tax=Geosmithia morbida TaxID=1094350 RepID=A0A9P4YT50_9HYPO|nr:Exo-beta-1,3-glucanase, GH17 family [Geosmithia morbida]KAF4122633.1 Exo-beta-1,3-glucanase, GH17 family [Geosmithia morbida]
MKGGFAVAAVAALATGANAINHRHGHELLHRKVEAESCGCTTIYYTTTGEATLVPAPAPSTSTSSSSKPVTPVSVATPTPVQPSTTATPTPTSTFKQPVPTPEQYTCPTPGTYTFSATTVTLSETTTVCGATSTHVTAGTHTLGGVTTVVETATTVTCPVATTTVSDGVVTSIVTSTEYVCPSAGTYTIAPITTTVTTEGDVQVPVPTSYAPGTYTVPEQVVTVTDTDYVTYCPYSTSEAPSPTSVIEAVATSEPAPSAAATTVASASSSAAATTSSAAAGGIDLSISLGSGGSSGSSSSASASSAAPSPSSGGGSSSGSFTGSFGGAGDHYGLTYTPYVGATGECKSAEQVDSDIQTIKADGFDVVRVYSTDCDTLENVGSACKKHGVDMIIGIFVKASGCSPDTPEVKEQIDAISSWASWDQVKLFVVGNEALMNGYCTASELRELITTVKSACSDYTGPYTIAETLDSWLEPSTSGALCDVVDFTGANIHPFFNAANFASLAGTFVQGQLSILDKICDGKKAVNLECGWPTGGSCLGSACPGKSEQAEALTDIRKKVGDRTVFFSFEDDKWKAPGPQGCEQFWGVNSYFSSLL